MVISLLDQLKKFLNLPDVMAEIYKEKETKRRLYSTFEDGEACRNSTVFQENPFGLQLQVYIDEVQMCVEVGHHTKKNKLVFFYFTIGNLPTKFRSAFKFINVLAICYNTTLLEHGANFILQPILDDIKTRSWLRICHRWRTKNNSWNSSSPGSRHFGKPSNRRF
jgi:hypothetical protein